MTRPGRYPPELRERAVRLVFEHQDEHASQWAAITSIAHKFGISAETLRKWVRRAETDDGLRPGLTSDERQRLKTLEREVRELRRANEILKSAAARSMGRCNNRREPSSRGLVLEGLSRPGVEPRGDGVEVDLGEDREIGLLGEVLAKHAVGVLVAAPLPGTPRVTEVHGDVGGHGETLVLGELHAPVPGEARSELDRKRLDVGGQSIDHRLGVFAVDLHQHHIAALALDKGGDVGVGRPGKQVPFPVTRDRTVLGLGGALADRDRVGDPCPALAPGRGMARSPHGPPGPQVGGELLAQHPRAWTNRLR